MVTALWPYGGPGSPYGSFAGKVVAPPVVVEPTSAGGWESYLHTRKRQDQRRFEEEKRQEQIEAQRLALLAAQRKLEAEQDRKVEEEHKTKRRKRVIAQINRGIESQQSEIEQIMAHLEALMALDALERDIALQALVQKRRNAAIVLLLYAS